MLYKSQFKALGIMAALLLASSVSGMAKCQMCFFCRKPVLDMPVTLTRGTVRSPEFTVKHKQYIIELQADDTIPQGKLFCLMGLYMFKDPNHCEMFGYHLAVEARWTLLAGGKVVAHGIVQGRDNMLELTPHHTSRWIGNFMGERGKKYVLEVTFTKDGTALRVANPHLVVDLNHGLDM